MTLRLISDHSEIWEYWQCAWHCLRVKKCGSTELKCCFIFFYFLLRVTVRHARHSTNSRTLNVHSKKIMSQAKNERFSDSCKIDKLVYTTKTSHTCCNQCIHYLIFHKKNWYLEIMPKLLCQIINFQKNREIFYLFIETRK